MSLSNLIKIDAWITLLMLQVMLVTCVVYARSLQFVTGIWQFFLASIDFIEVESRRVSSRTVWNVKSLSIKF